MQKRSRSAAVVFSILFERSNSFLARDLYLAVVR